MAINIRVNDSGKDIVCLNIKVETARKQDNNKSIISNNTNQQAASKIQRIQQQAKWKHVAIANCLPRNVPARITFTSLTAKTWPIPLIPDQELSFNLKYTITPGPSILFAKWTSSFVLNGKTFDSLTDGTKLIDLFPFLSKFQDGTNEALSTIYSPGQHSYTITSPGLPDELNNISPGVSCAYESKGSTTIMQHMHMRKSSTYSDSSPNNTLTLLN
jgi:hypothetical protein